MATPITRWLTPDLVVFRRGKPDWRLSRVPSGNRLGIAVVVLVTFEEWFHVFRRDQTNIVSKGGKLRAM
jgi:hypothetical protein